MSRTFEISASFSLTRGPRDVPRFAVIASLIVAALMALASLGGLLLPATYARETASWRIQGLTQDWFDLVIAAPWLVVTALFTLRGSRRAVFLLGGGLAYVAYSFVIYAFAVHFNALFLIYCAVLGLSAFALGDLSRRVVGQHVRTWFDDRAPRRVAGGVLIGAATLFSLLWLAEIVPAIVRGTTPAVLDDAGLVTNPVHVLDLSLVLPTLLVSGLLLWRGRGAGHALGAMALTFSTLMGLTIAVLAVAMDGRDAAGLAAVMAAMAIADAVLLALLLRSVRSLPHG